MFLLCTPLIWYVAVSGQSRVIRRVGFFPEQMTVALILTLPTTVKTGDAPRGDLGRRAVDIRFVA